MRNILTDIEIPLEDPFKNDELGRKIIGENLTRFIENTTEPIVLSIDAEWGQGKTTFLKMWGQMLQNKGFTTLYYSAWENDYNNDALITLIGEIEEEAKKIISTNREKKDRILQFLQTTKQAGGNVLVNSLPFLLKILTSGLIETKDLKDNIGELAKELANKQIEDYKKSKNEVLNFKKSLKKLSIELNTSDEIKPLVILVDELDRCKPTFSLEVLERIKHIFSTPNVIFVLAIDKAQLIESIRTVYGVNLNSSGYLKRFIDIEFTLPVPDKKRYAKVLEKRFELQKYLGDTESDLNRNDAYKVLEYIREFVEYFDCTLREMEKCYSKLVYTFKITSSDYDLYPLSLSILVLVSIKFGELFKLFKNQDIDPDQLFDELSNKSKKLYEFCYSNAGIIAWHDLFSASSTDNDLEEKISFLTEKKDDESLSARDRDVFERRLDMINRQHFHRTKYIKYIMQNIEMVSHFER